jgi:hypothetical protein
MVATRELSGGEPAPYPKEKCISQSLLIKQELAYAFVWMLLFFY